MEWENALPLKGKLLKDPEPKWKNTGNYFESVFIDTGENGIFSRGEFEAITTEGQMEFVTPEEIQDFLRIEHFVKINIEKHKFVNGEIVEVNPEEFSVSRAIIPKWEKRNRGRFGRGFGHRPSHRYAGHRRFGRFSRRKGQRRY